MGSIWGNGYFKADDDYGKEYYEPEVLNFVGGVISNGWRVPFLAGIHEQPNDIEDFADSQQVEGQLDIEIIEVVEEIDRKKAGHDH